MRQCLQHSRTLRLTGTSSSLSVLVLHVVVCTEIWILHVLDCPVLITSLKLWLYLIGHWICSFYRGICLFHSDAPGFRMCKGECTSNLSSGLILSFHETLHTFQVQYSSIELLQYLVYSLSLWIPQLQGYFLYNLAETEKNHWNISSQSFEWLFLSKCRFCTSLAQETKYILVIK